MLEQNEINTINNLKFPMVNIRRTSNLAVAPINTFSLAIMLFMFAAPLMHWCSLKSPTFGVSLACGGVCLYIMGIYNWYQNKNILCFIDFMFSFLNLLICYFVRTVEDKSDEKLVAIFENYMIATFFVLILVALAALAVASKKKGLIHLVYLGLLILSDVFIIVWIYRFEKGDKHLKRLRKVAGYFMFVASLALWYTGVGRFINEIFHTNMIPLVEQDL
jgi:hypothetical protein